MDDKLNRFIRMESEKEADRIMEEVNSDPGMHNVKAPEDIHEKLFSQIREYEAKKAQPGLSEEQKELIELGKIYKRRRKWTKWIVLAAVLVMGMMFGITSMGGPEKVVETVKRMMAGREQTKVNTDDGRIKAVETVSEEEAYQRIKDEFGIVPVKLDSLPEGMEFKEVVISKETQSAQLAYEQKDGGVIVYTIKPNYRIGSTASDIEDKLVEEHTTEVGGICINIKQYYVEENNMERWMIEFEYQNIYYLLRVSNLKINEVEKIIENLYLFEE